MRSKVESSEAKDHAPRIVDQVDFWTNSPVDGSLVTRVITKWNIDQETSIYTEGDSGQSTSFDSEQLKNMAENFRQGRRIAFSMNYYEVEALAEELRKTGLLVNKKANLIVYLMQIALRSRFIARKRIINQAERMSV